MARTAQEYLDHLKQQAEAVRAAAVAEGIQDPFKLDQREASFWREHSGHLGYAVPEDDVAPGCEPQAYRLLALHMLGDIACRHPFDAYSITGLAYLAWRILLGVSC